MSVKTVPMHAPQFTDGQLIGVLKEAEAGTPVQNLRRTHGIDLGISKKRKPEFLRSRLTAASD